MKNDEIIKHIENNCGKENVKSVVTKENGKYIVSVMKNYTGGEGLGVMGAVTFLEIHFTTKESAQKLSDQIKNHFK